jgi:hypothetical protein
MSDEDMRPYYDFSKGVRGKYAALYGEGANIVRIDDDILDIFPNEDAVNEALHALAPLLRAQRSGEGKAAMEARETKG